MLGSQEWIDFFCLTPIRYEFVPPLERNELNLVEAQIVYQGHSLQTGHPHSHLDRNLIHAYLLVKDQTKL